ncbi:MAG: hypothetical protein CMJ84_15660 [Planctomycetes bacterium]|jgi:hypothetical protein|nr:hypothetical protein [Planctomycetota bacterium]MDP6410488.1 hypothetical protein [Planctomycetota bacterium]
MAPELPSFFRRRLRLHEARRALLAGSPAAALKRLDDPCLSGSADAERLRARAREALAREAPSRGTPSGETGPASAADSGVASALEELLAQMRAARDGAVQGVSPRGGVARAPAEPARPLPVAVRGSEPPAVAEEEPGGAATDEPAPLRFLLAVDDAGEFLVAFGEQVVLGHARMGEADLPLLADLDARHARIRGGESFHGGALWLIEPLAGQSITVRGAPIGAGGAELGDGDEIGLAPNLGLRFFLPEVASGVCRLELLHGAECFGASRVLLVKPRSGARLRIGARRDRHIAVRGLPYDVDLELADGELALRCEAGLRAGPGSSGAPAPAELRIPCPPERRVDIVVGRAEGGRPPFAFSVSPLPDVTESAR